MPNYRNGKIYAIRSHQTPDFYIGSTTQPLHVRFGGHKRKYNQYKNGKYHYTSCFKILDYDDCYIELLENCSCSNKNELDKRKGELIREMNCVNKNIAGRTPQEYREQNKEMIKDKKKVYREKNKEKIAESSKAYYEANRQEIIHKQKQKFTCECGSQCRVNEKSRHFKTRKHQTFIQSNSQ